MSRSIPSAAAVDYPDTDGKPMAENDAQRDAIMYGIGALKIWFGAREDVYVSGDLLIYYEEGNPKVSVAPDVFVVFGAADYPRLNYKLWEEPKAPDFALEVASPSTWRDDLGWKRELYARLGVKEYWQYDPVGGLLPAKLLGWRPAGGAYEPQPVIRSLDGALTLRSETLGLDLWVKGEKMRFRDPATGRDLLSHDEACAARREELAARQTAEARAEQEATARRSAEARAEQEAAAHRAAKARIAELEALVRGNHG